MTTYNLLEALNSNKIEEGIVYRVKYIGAMIGQLVMGNEYNAMVARIVIDSKAKKVVIVTNEYGHPLQYFALNHFELDIIEPVNVGKIEAYVHHSHEYFNPTCNATIPEYWECEIYLDDSACQKIFGRSLYTGEHRRIYGTSQESEYAAIEDCLNELKNLNLTGKLKVYR